MRILEALVAVITPRLRSLGSLFFDDAHQTTSTWASGRGVPLTNSTAEWNSYKNTFGEVSLFDAIRQAHGAGIDVNGTEVTSVAYPSESVSISGSSAVVNRSFLQRAAPELEDYKLGDGIKNQWRPDLNNVTLAGATVSALRDRITYKTANTLVQATSADQPAFVHTSPVFGGSSAISDGGVGHNHTKRLSAAGSDSLANPWWRFVVFAATSNITQNCQLMAAGDTVRNSEIYTDASDSFSTWRLFNGTSASVMTDGFDPTSRLAHCLIVNSYDTSNPRFRGYLIRADGKITHLEAPSLGGGNVSGTLSLLNAPFAYLVLGFPGMIADAGQGTGLLSALNCGQISEYLSLRHGFTRPGLEVFFGGNSLSELVTLWPKAIVLPNVSARFYGAVSGWTTQKVAASLPFAASEKTSGVAGIRRIWCGGEIINEITGNVSSEDAITHLRDLIATVRACGFSKIVMSNCGPAGSLTAPQEVVRVAVNTAFRLNWQAWGIDAPVNIGDANPVNGQVPPATMLDTNSADYDAGHLHHTTAGYTKRGELFRQSLTLVGC